MGLEVCIINAAIGGNYLSGQKRLLNSLYNGNYDGDAQTWDAWPEGHGMNEANPYNIKPAVMARALAMAKHRILIWMDSTCVATAHIAPLIERIKERGYYLASSGYSAAQTCTDAQLAAAGITRGEAERVPDSATGCIGIDLADQRATEFLINWIEWAERGLFAGSRTHNPKDSQDPRFLFGRQDQSAATLLAHIHGMELDHMGGLTAYWPGTPTTVIAYRGI